MKIRLGASAKFENVKAVEFHTGSAHGHPGVVADVHMENGDVVRGRDFDNCTFSDPKEAREVAEKEMHRMADAAKRHGVPVIKHTIAAEARRNEYKQTYIPAGIMEIVPPMKEISIWWLIVPLLIVATFLCLLVP